MVIKCIYISREYQISLKKNKSEYPNYILTSENIDAERRYFGKRAEYFILSEYNEFLIKKTKIKKTLIIIILNLLSKFRQMAL